MSTAIEWTDETWNPVVGCTQISKGCGHCYAKEQHDRRHKAALAGKAMHPQYLQPFATVQLMPERLEAPLHWRKPRRVFVNSVSDLFHEDVPDEFLEAAFGIMALCARHTFQILTKRPARMREWLARASLDRCLAKLCVDGFEFDRALRADQTYVNGPWPLPNVWLGVSVENQDAANERVPLLLQTPAAVRFLSCEPLLGPVNLMQCDVDATPYMGAPPAWRRYDALTGYVGTLDHKLRGAATRELAPVDWVIIGGESGPRARRCDVQWIRNITLFCKMASVAVFVKQLGAHPVCRNDDGADEWPGAEIPFDERYQPAHQGETARLYLRDSKGGNPEEWPESLRVREFPAAKVPA